MTTSSNYCAVMSAFGTQRTSLCALSMSAFGGKADIPSTNLDVCF
jgi:hypothetical protein